MMCTAAPTRSLGRANALVARSLLSPDASIEGESAAAVPPRLPFGAEALPSLRPWLEALSEGLTERAEEAAQERSLSQQSQ